MPSEPDNKMDELLKAYARKRREDSGAPLELHPATRKLLQAEVARSRQPAGRASDSWWKMLAVLWPRLALATALFVGLGVVSWGLIHSQYSARMARREEAVTLAKRVEPAPAQPVDRLDLAAAPPRLQEEKSEDLLARTRAEPARSPLDKSESRRTAGVAGGAEFNRAGEERPVVKGAELEADKSRFAALDRDIRLQPEDEAKLGKPVDVKPKSAAPLSLALTPPSQPNEKLSESEIVAAKPMAGLSKLRADPAPTTVARGAAAPEAAGATSSLFDQETTAGLGRLSPLSGMFTTSYFSVTSTTWAAPALGFDGPSVLHRDGTALPFATATNSLVAANGIAAPPLLYGVVPMAPLASPPPLAVESLVTVGQSLGTTTKTGPVANQKRLGQQTEPTALAAVEAFHKETVPGATVDTRNQPVPPATASPLAQVPPSPVRSSQVAAVNSRQFNFRSQVQRQMPAVPQSRVLPALLNSFQLEQTGNHVRIVDGDNSVYEGQVVTATTAGYRLNEPAAAEPEGRRALLIDQQKKDTKQASGTAAADLSGAVSFRVSGTNVTAKQLVTIEATVAPASQANGPARARQVQDTTTPPQSPTVVGVVIKTDPSAVRVLGRARLGTNELPIDALGTATQR